MGFSYGAKRLMLLAIVLAFGSLSIAEVNIVGAFYVFTKDDPITGAKGVYIYTNAVEYPRYYDNAALWLRCRGAEFDIFVDADTYLDNDPLKVMYRIGGGKPEGPYTWDPSTDGTAAFVRYPLALLRKLLKGDGGKFAFRVWDYQGNELTYVFSLRGIQKAAKALFCIKRP